MNNLIQTVALKDVKCFALHGYYAEEQLIGTYFLVDLETIFKPLAFSDELTQTINYENLNEIIINEMKNTQKLLETVLKNIISKVVETYSYVETVHVSIKKLNPPLSGQVGCSFVKLTYTSAN